MASFIVRVRQTTLVDVVCENCTEEQARSDPFEYSTAETVVDMVDWEVQSTKPNP